jgi:hypothetical protein
VEITVTISRSVENWGAENEDQPVVDKAAQLLADTMAAEIKEDYPDAEVTATTAETIDGQSLRTVRCTAAPDDETWEDVTGYATRGEDLWEWALQTATV